jgi:sugar phosphate isomerase/epimerase
MGFKYACADFTFPLLEHDKALRLISLLDFEGVDIGLFEGRSHLQPSGVLAHDAEGHGRELKKKVGDAGIAVADVFFQGDTDFAVKAINHPDAAVRAEARDYFLRTLEFAASAGSGHVTCLPGVLFQEESPEASWGRAVEELSARVELAQEAKLVFGVEPHLGSIVDTPQKALDLVRAVEGLTVTLDYTHFTKVGIADAEVEPLVACASHFHARGARKGALQTVIAENTIDYPRVIRALMKTGYTGYIGVEYTWVEWENCNRNDNVSESILLRDVMKQAEEEG